MLKRLSYLLRRPTAYFFSKKAKLPPKPKDLIDKPQHEDKTELTTEKPKAHQLMDDTYTFEPIPGLADKHAVSLNPLQKSIFEQSKFNLMDSAIEPKTTSIATSFGLDLSKNQSLLEIDLGNIQVKKDNEIYLSEVDPYNIPEYYNILLKDPKQISLIGTVQKDGGAKPTGKEEMNVTGKTFEQMSLKEQNIQSLGVDVPKPMAFRKKIKFFIGFVFVFVAFIQPYISAELEYVDCMESIKAIEIDRLNELNNLKSKSYTDTILHNPDFNFRLTN